MKKILVLPLLLCLIFCSFLSLDKNLDEFDPDRTAYGSYDHRVVWGSYASSDKAALPQQEVLDSRAVLYSESDMSALMDCQYIEEIPSFPAVICRIRTSSLGFLGRLTSNLSWLGALLQLIHIIYSHMPLSWSCAYVSQTRAGALLSVLSTTRMGIN